MLNHQYSQNQYKIEVKEGNLAGSYIIDDDGEVTEYDEDGDKVGSGY